MESIYRQGLDESRFEVIIVDDGTPDKSLEVIADIISQHDNISVIHQENQGVSGARNTGIAHAQGEYVIMPDPDDMLIDYAMPPVLDKAMETKADMVIAGFLEMNDNEIESIASQPSPNTNIEWQEHTGHEMLLNYYNPHQSFVWHTLFRRQFLQDNNITFYPRIRFQDIPYTTECYLKAKRCMLTNWKTNIYRKGHESATSSFNMKKSKEFCRSIAQTWKLTHWDGHTPETLARVENNIFVNFTFLVSWTAYSFHDAADRTNILRYLLSLAPDIRFRNGIKQRVTTFFFRNFPQLYMDVEYYSRKLKHKLH
jgi:glycosyltransferase involved in cell wall biosynthesis